MGTNECSQPASKSSWDSQDFGDVNMVLKMVHFHKSSRPQWVNEHLERGVPPLTLSPAFRSSIALSTKDEKNFTASLSKKLAPNFLAIGINFGKKTEKSFIH